MSSHAIRNKKKNVKITTDLHRTELQYKLDASRIKLKLIYY